MSIPCNEFLITKEGSREVPPVFEIYSDRIEITSCGGLPAGLSQEDFFGCRSMSRNRELMRVFKDIGLVEQLGSGMSRILKAYDRSAFRISDNFLTVSFRFPKGVTPQVDPQVGLAERIITYCAEPHSKKELAEHFGFKDAKSFGERHLKPLLDSGRLKLTNPDKPTSSNQKYIASSVGNEELSHIISRL